MLGFRVWPVAKFIFSPLHLSVVGARAADPGKKLALLFRLTCKLWNGGCLREGVKYRGNFDNSRDNRGPAYLSNIKSS